MNVPAPRLRTYRVWGDPTDAGDTIIEARASYDAARLYARVHPAAEVVVTERVGVDDDPHVVEPRGPTMRDAAELRL